MSFFSQNLKIQFSLADILTRFQNLNFWALGVVHYHPIWILFSGQLKDHRPHFGQQCLIRYFSRLVSTQTSSHEHKTYYCRNCLQGYYTKKTLANHFAYCRDHISARIEFPAKGSFLNFNHAERKMRVPFVMYANFESFIKPINTCSPNEKQSFTKKYQKHIPSSFCYYIKCFDETLYKGKLVTYCNE